MPATAECNERIPQTLPEIQVDLRRSTIRNIFKILLLRISQERFVSDWHPGG